MRQYLLFVAFAVLWAPACHIVKGPACVLEMGDPRTANQLLSGFYGIEMHAWRWTAHEFSVALKPPPGAAQRGSRLKLDLFIPKVLIQELGPMTLAANIDGHALKREKYLSSGTHAYWRDIPAEVLDTNVVIVTFCFDKSLPPVGMNGRELGAVVSHVGLSPK